MENAEEKTITSDGRAARGIARHIAGIIAAAGVVFLLAAQSHVPAVSENGSKSAAAASRAPAAALSPPPGGTSAIVERVIDGDTLDVLQGETIVRVRLLGVDSPETVDPRKLPECFGKEASDFAKTILTGKRVSLETDLSQPLFDKYGRLLAYIFLGGELFNERLIAEGFAREYTYRTRYKHQADFRQAERRAQEAGKGLWGGLTCAGRRVLPR